MRGNHYYKKIGLRIAFLRKKRNFSQYQLADKAQINRSHLAAVETGKANPTVKFLGKIGRALKVNVGEFFR